MQDPVFYGALLAISLIKPRSVVTNYSRLSQSPSTRGLGMSRTKVALSRLRHSRSSLRDAFRLATLAKRGRLGASLKLQRMYEIK